MLYEDFVLLAPDVVSQTVNQIGALNMRPKLGVALPLNGTRRWYLDTYHVAADHFFEHWVHYQQVTHERLLALATMLFEDGVNVFYTPVIGRALFERGADYMQVVTEGVRTLADETSLRFYQAHDIEASCYGELTLLPDDLQGDLRCLESMNPAKYALRYGIMADRPLSDLIQRTAQYTQRYGIPPTEQQLLSNYYGGEPVPVGLWIGCDQPTVYDVPFVLNESTALYFLQFPTPYLERALWRRILYDYLFVRGDEETLYPDNLSAERQITGLGVRREGFWTPSAT